MDGAMKNSILDWIFSRDEATLYKYVQRTEGRSNEHVFSFIYQSSSKRRISV